jgi:hypothetical protein
MNLIKSSYVGKNLKVCPFWYNGRTGLKTCPYGTIKNPLMVSLSNHSGLIPPFDRIRVSGNIPIRKMGGLGGFSLMLTDRNRKR